MKIVRSYVSEATDDYLIIIAVATDRRTNATHMSKGGTLELDALRASELRHSNDRLIGSKINIINWYDVRWSSSRCDMHQKQKPPAAAWHKARTHIRIPAKRFHSFIWNWRICLYVLLVDAYMQNNEHASLWMGFWAHAFGKHLVYIYYTYWFV